MNEARMINDARRAWYCRPDAEGVELVICELGTPWCSVDHNEDDELKEMFQYSISSATSSTIPAHVLVAMARLADEGNRVKSSYARVKSARPSDEDIWTISYESRKGDHLSLEVEKIELPKIQEDHYERIIAKIREQKEPSIDKSSDVESRRVILIALVVAAICIALMTWTALTL